MTRFLPKFFLFATLCAALVSAMRAQQEPAKEPQGELPKNVANIIVVQVTGEVYVFTSGETYRFALRAGSMVTEGQMIATGPKASVMLAFSNGATVTIGENSLVALDEFTQTPFGAVFKMSEALSEPSSSQTNLDLVRGELIANVKKLNKEEGSNFKVNTPLGVAGIRGTTFQISYIPDSLQSKPNARADSLTADFAIVMLEGLVEMNVPNRSRPILIPQGKQLVLENVDMADTSGAALGDDSEASEPSTSSAAAQAMLMQRVQTMLNATADISIPGTPGAKTYTPNIAGAVSDTASDQGNQQQSADTSAETDSSGESLSPSPPPQPDAPRLSPTDGTGA
ncbi:hypothetical protein M2447_001683 [Ereboglobus sp. PH5-10]|uniref:FecR family protein n=1 Tax=Ereboglobus sp. PH5-10 TaxID=2940629 RepID=UPI00240592F9|nr:FecR domain-containing protein [Ereboglobus sp. PH5-10]MDF9827585.1 hypothetical protein [Ereboglobus sp. PH5-10]